MNDAVNELARTVGIRAACDHVGRSRATHYRQNQAPLHGPPSPRPRSVRALPDHEVEQILETLNSERFCDLAPAQIWATLLDEGTYLCSVSTMYRLLRARHQLRDRRNQRRHPAHVKPELVATGPNQVWSWDITKLAGPHKWNWFHLYVILDIHSRYAVGWLVAPRESARLAEELIAACVNAENIATGQLSIHADRGTSMTSKTVSQLLADFGILQSHSRPRVSNDNPYSESQFKTLKQSPTTTTTVTQASATTHPPTSTTAKPTPFNKHAKPSSTRPINNTPTDPTDHPKHPKSPPSPGSTNPRKHPNHLNNQMSHIH
jgi:putative transposase